MIAERTFDPELISSILFEPKMWETIAEDNFEPRGWTPDVYVDAWVSVRDEDDVYGLWLFKALNSVTCEIHPHVVVKHRSKHSYANGVLALKWLYDNTPFEKVLGWVPTIYPHIKKYGESLGFQVEGRSRKSWLKNGELHDQWLMGITRNEIRGLIDGFTS